MQLTQYTDYSLRTLIYLALLPEGSTIGEIARRYGISKNHLVKVAHNLSKLGYIHATRGKSGGLRLAQKPAAISVGRVVRDFEPNFNLVECFNPEENCCPITPTCRLKTALQEAQSAFMTVLDQYTLEDIAKDGEETLQLLGH